MNGQIDKIICLDYVLLHHASVPWRLFSSKSTVTSSSAAANFLSDAKEVVCGQWPIDYFLDSFHNISFRQNVGYIHTERMAPKHLETVLTAKIIATIINEPPFCGVLKFRLQICALPTTSRTLWPYWILVLYEITSKSMQCNIIAHISQDRHNRRWRNFLKPAFFFGIKNVNM